MVWHPGSYSLIEMNWTEIKEQENSWDHKDITKMIYYILSADDNTYGTHYQDTTLNCLYVPQTNGTNIWQVSQKQYAIWLLIDDFFEVYGETANEDAIFNQNNNTYCELYNKAKSEAGILREGEMNDEVYIWLYTPWKKVSGTDRFWQNLILAGKKENPPVVQQEKGKITIEKYDSSTGTPLKGAVFEIYKGKCEENGIIMGENGRTQFPTDQNGKVSINGLDLNQTYYVYEVTAPEGYELEKQWAYDSVSEKALVCSSEWSGANRLTENSSSITITCYNSKNYRALLKIEKVDADDYNIKLKGVKFGLYQDDDLKYTATTNSLGQATISGIEAGDYKLIEISNPNEGYEHNNGRLIMDYYYLSSGVEYYFLGDNAIKNEKKNTGGFSINKKGKMAGESEQTLNNVWFGISKKSEAITIDNYSEYCEDYRWVDVNGQISFKGLEAGRYYVWEYNYNSRYEYYSEFIYIGYVDVEAGNNNCILKQTTNKKGIEVRYLETSGNDIINTYYGSIQFNKYGEDNKKLIPDSNQKAKFILCKKDADIYTACTGLNELEENGIKFENLSKGTYAIFEWSNTFKGYELDYQDNIKEFSYTGVDGKTYTIKTPCVVDDIVINESNLNVEKNGQNRKYGKITIKKYGETYDGKAALANASFELYDSTSNQKISIGNESTFTTDSNGQKTIGKIPYGSYTLYETIAPEGYEIKIQPGYDQTTGRVKIADINIGDQTTVNLIADNKENTDKTKFRKCSTTDATYGKSSEATIEITNHKYINIKGYVFEDIPNEKKNTYNNIYDGESKGVKAYSNTIDATEEIEQKITSDVTIKLFQISINNTIKTIQSKDVNNDNEYTFTKVDASKLNDYYILFDYSKYKEDQTATDKKQNQYITCVPYFDNTDSINISNTSKALVNKEDIKEKDEDLVERANTGNLLGHILGNSVRRGVYYSYEDNTPTINYVNLGIKRLPDTSFTISNNLSKVIISVNGYSFTYNYGSNGVEPDQVLAQNSFPIVKWQSKTDYLTYTRTIYPSDITTLNLDEAEKKIKVKVVYKITIKNTTKYNIANLYAESKMVIENINNKYDTSNNTNTGRYELDDEIWTFDQYEIDNGIEKGLANCNLELDSNKEENEKSKVFEDTTYSKDNVPKNKSVSTYITFDVRDKAIMDILNGETYERFPTYAEVTAKHIYSRKDRYWIWNDGSASTANSNENHITKSKVENEEAPYLKFKLAEDRIISGIVFEDSKTQDSINKNEALGDGIYGENVDGEEENRVEKVQVDLGYFSTKEDGTKEFITAKLYPNEDVLNNLYAKDNNGNFIKQGDKWKLVDDAESKIKSATTSTNEKGEYSLRGIVPGTYYIRFTYGNGEQIICDKNGNKIPDINGEDKKVYSEDYKSTIIKGPSVKDAFIKYNDIESESTDTTSLWYLDNNNRIYNYNTAVDYIDYNFEYNKVIDFTKKERNTSTLVSAQTPRISIPIEFTKEIQSEATSTADPFSEYSLNNMSFGIIEKPEARIELIKEISNVKVKLQNGQVLVSGNPTQNIPYVANLDEIWSTTGSHYSKVEMDGDYMYGSVLEIEYLLTITNKSDVTYTGEMYYKYGESDLSKEATINIIELLEYIDPNLKYLSSTNATSTLKVDATLDDNYENALSSLKEKIKDRILESGKRVTDNYFEEIKKIDDTKNSDGTDNTAYNLYTEIKEENSSKQTKATLKVTAQKYLTTQDDDADYESYAQVSKVIIAKNTYKDPTGAQAEIPTDYSKIVISPSTGLDRSMKFVEASIIILMTIGISIFLKKIKT